MLKKLRITLAVLCFTALCLAFWDVSGRLAPKLAFLAKAQLVPAALAGSLAMVAGILVATLLFGRVYCSVLCPLGVFQDIVSRLGGRRGWHFRPARPWLRVGALALFVLAILIGIPIVFSLLEPYSAFGRMATDIFAPVWQTASNGLAAASARAETFAIGPTPVWQKGLTALAAAILTFVVIAALAFRSGRMWCNTLCPVGTLLGWCSRYGLLRPSIDAAACVHCGLCAKSCKASCIDASQATIDASRCVGCFTCLDVCPHRAITYAPARKTPVTAPKNDAPQQPDLARRTLLTTATGILLLPATALARDHTAKPAALTRKKHPSRTTPITPPGSSGLRAFTEHCTACQLCVSACPNQVLGAFDQGAGLLQPSLSFERGYCQVNCVTCSEVCPTGAIRPITPAQKSATQIGRAVLDADRCIIHTDKVQCTACSKACPTNAAALVGPVEGERWLAIDPERCTGCGACEYVCPVHPVAAIHVEGNLEHRRI